MDPKTWADGVSRGKKLVQEGRANKWALADLALELFPLQTAGGTVPHVQNIKRWIREVGLDVVVATVEQWREMASKWPVDRRQPECSWTVHKILKSHPDRFRLIRPHMRAVEAVIAIRQVRPASVSPGFPALLDFVKASESFLQTALKQIPKRGLNQEQAEALGEAISRLEANLDTLLERTGMADAEELLLAA